MTEAFDGSGIIVDDDLAESWLRQAKELEGWADGHEYAPHPVRISDFDEDDVDY